MTTSGLRAASAFQLESKQNRHLLALEQFPSVAQVQFYTPGGSLDWTQNCAASILNQLYVLSAASCFSGPNYPGPAHRRIRVGTNYGSMGGGQVVYVSIAMNYEGNNSSAAVVHDISVVRLTSRLVYSDLARQASLLRQGSVVPIGVAIKQLGWGGRYAVPLQIANLTTYRSSVDQPSNLITAVSPWGSSAWANTDAGGPWIWEGVTVGWHMSRYVIVVLEEA
ncbi:chymotrypsin-2-like [Maniola hyperantus]|uniref:chymotrypsin-2-like n=1 Tax=Aphantopus hyperantus TaxID=2795564 RepID=UPI003747A435